MDILNITEKPEIDESIEKYEYHSYEPITGTDLNRPGEIRINIETQDLFTHPSESYLVFDGKLVKNVDDAVYADVDVIMLTNNAMVHLFNNIIYQLSGQEIESLFHPGQATTMFGLLKFPGDFQKSTGLNQVWFNDTGATAHLENNTGFGVQQEYIIQKPDPKGTFSFRVPLKNIFGFCDDYEKVVYGFKHELTRVRKGDNDAIFKTGAVAAVGDVPAIAEPDDGKIVLTKLSWYMPHVLPNDQEKLTLYKTIESKSNIPVGYRMVQCDSISVTQTRNFTWRLSVKSAPEKPRWIIVALAFQTDKSGNQEHNPSIFDHCNLTNMFVMLNSRRYPEIDYDDMNFTQQKFSRVYEDAAAFRTKFYNVEELISSPNITPADYKELFPMFVFDVTKQSEKLKNSVTDIQIKAQFSANVAANTEAFAVVVSDRSLIFQSDGQKMRVEY